MEVERPPAYDLSHVSQNDETWYGYTLLIKKIQKIYKLCEFVNHKSNSTDISIFSPEISNFCLVQDF